VCIGLVVGFIVDNKANSHFEGKKYYFFGFWQDYLRFKETAMKETSIKNTAFRKSLFN
jgi:hypothetical protein